MKSLLCFLVWAPLMVGQASDCRDPVFLPVTGYDVAFDPNRIVMYWDPVAEPNEPAPRRRLLRPPIGIALGQTARIDDGWACDPDGDAMQIAASKGTISLRPDGMWTWSYKPTSIGLEYIDVTLCDIRPTSDSKSRSGTIVVQTVPANRPPAFGCGSRP